MSTLKPLAVIAVATLGLFGIAGCNTAAFCFANCEDPFGEADAGDSGTGQQDSGPLFQDSGSDACIGIFCGNQPDTGTGGQCVETNAGVEICDNVDNDCDGLVDEPDDIDFNLPRNCGNCATNCSLLTDNVDQPTCSPPANNLGAAPGTCDYNNCAQDFYDVDGDRSNGCEYFCPFNPNGTNTNDPGGADGCAKDDDCDGEVDEDVNTCDDVQNCGRCGKQCVIANGTAVCTTTATGGDACTEANTRCEVDQCDPGFFDVDGSPDNGCEYECPVAVPSAEVCDGIDNDCDARIDNLDADLTMNDPDVGQACFGGTDGECADSSHEGVQKCIGGAISCCDKDSGDTGADLRNGECSGTVPPFVVRPGDLQEVCNNKDDDCDGSVDDNPVDEGAVCGSSVGDCQVGTVLCVSGSLNCAGATGPQADVCDGQDNDCDGIIDGTIPAGVLPISCNSDADCAGEAPAVSCKPRSSNPAQRVCVQHADGVGDPTTGVPLACNVPPAAPPGATQPCQAGVSACLNGVPACPGSILPQQGTDECFEDSNCDGTLTGQSGLSNSDPLNCGTCGNDCNSLGAGVVWACNAGVCQPNGCAQGFIDCDGNASDCETACTFSSSSELCNNIDDDCDCFVDAADPEGVTLQNPVQACGVSPAATDPGCTTGVVVACVGGGFTCTFPGGYCTTGDCSTSVDVCDGSGLDNNCDGVADETFVPPIRVQGFLGQACFSDDGLPAPGHGPCRTTGNFVCDGPGTNTQCNATIDLTQANPELCDGIENDCDGLIDAADPDLPTDDTRVNQPCFGGTQGVCADPSNAGTTVCTTGVVVCQGPNVVNPGDLLEVCDGLDNDCDGLVDDADPDLPGDDPRVGQTCFGGTTGQCIFPAHAGSNTCVSGAITCAGPNILMPFDNVEVCDNIDNDCDGNVDNNLTDTGGVCDVPPAVTPNAACPGATNPCSSGNFICGAGGSLQCGGSVTAPPGTPDSCCDDTNCNGILENVPDFQNDPLNCGGCGVNCNAIDPTGHGVWSCVTGGCVRTGCDGGFIDCDANGNDCETACTFTSSTELCNGVDDNCNCQVDTDILPANIPSTVQVCGVGAAATEAGCISTETGGNVVVACTAGAWACTFPAGYCGSGSPPSCASTSDTCDGIDNNCNGTSDEAFRFPAKPVGGLTTPCATDDGQPPPGDGACRGMGVFVCNIAGDDTTCNATFDPSGAGPELCDGLDNDCDSLIDEPFSNPGTPPVTVPPITNSFVRPDVVRVAASLWMYQYEASRPNATVTSPGTGNGYHTSAPAGTTLDATVSCSVAGNVPWFNVTPDEVTQTCLAAGGRICTMPEWRSMCQATASCTRGYAPRTGAPANCTQNGIYPAGPTRVCNVGPYDFDTSIGGIQDGLLPTGYMGGDPDRPSLINCGSDWGGLQGNAAGTRLFDTLGNLREITQNGANYTLMGGAFNNATEDGAACDFTFFNVPVDFQLLDTGYRCCFDSNPSP